MSAVVDHVDMLMKISIEGPEVPDVRSSTPEHKRKVSQLMDHAAWSLAQKTAAGMRDESDC